MKLTRRHVLKAAGVSLALPWLEGLAGAELKKEDVPRRMICVCSPLGLHAGNFFPKEAGAEYGLTPYLEVVGEYRKDFTVISGLSHPEVGPTHDSIDSFLTGAPHPEVRAGFRNTISMDQVAAEYLRGRTRHSSLVISTDGQGLSWTQSGAPVPSDTSPSRVFQRLFIEGTPDEVRRERTRLRDGQSILDMLADQRATLRRKLGPKDRHKAEEYFSSIRELEVQLAEAEEWSKRPKPKVDLEPLQDISNPAEIIQKNRMWFDLVHLAVQTDSTRLVTFTLASITGVPDVEGVSLGYHDLSHHGQDENKLAQLRKIELAQMTTLRDFLKKLGESSEGEGTLLDRTMVYFSSNLGNASSHDVKNLPILIAGGGFRHGRHLAFDPGNPPPLSNLYVSMLQRLGMETERFSTSTGRLTGLEMG